jgi:predicted dehydrogenase
MRIKTAVIGCGAITRVFHLPSLLRNPTFELVALVDPNIDAANAAIVAAPPHLHAEICITLLLQGIHVLCEKPMATSVAEGEAMMKAANDGKAVMLIGMQKHYCPNTKLLKDILIDGMLGQITGIKLVSAIKSQWDTANVKRFNPEYSKGGVLFEYGIYWIYRMVYWFGNPKLVRYADDRIDGVEVNAFIESINHAYGQEIPGSMYFSWDHNLKNMITIAGEKGAAEVREDDDSSVFVTKVINEETKIMEIKNCNEEGEVDLFGLQLAHFAECIDGKIQDPEPTGLGLEALKFVEECYRNRAGVDQPWVFFGIDIRKNAGPAHLP